MERFFRDIEITDFRGFDHLNMEKFSKVNVFVGANNVGKTSILEAIFMLVGMSVPMLPARVNYWRKNSNVSLDDIRYLFHSINLKTTPTLKAHTTEGERKVQLSASLYVDTESANGSSGHAGIKRLNIDFGTKISEDCPYHTVLYVGNDGSMQQLIDDKYKEQMNCLFISSDKNDSNALSNFVTLVKRGKKDIVLETLQTFDNDITGITLNNYYDVNHPFVDTFDIPYPTDSSDIILIGELNTKKSLNIWNESGDIYIFTKETLRKCVNKSSSSLFFIKTSKQKILFIFIITI